MLRCPHAVEATTSPNTTDPTKDDGRGRVRCSYCWRRPGRLLLRLVYGARGPSDGDFRQEPERRCPSHHAHIANIPGATRRWVGMSFRQDARAPCYGTTIGGPRSSWSTSKASKGRIRRRHQGQNTSFSNWALGHEPSFAGEAEFWGGASATARPATPPSIEMPKCAWWARETRRSRRPST